MTHSVAYRLLRSFAFAILPLFLSSALLAQNATGSLHGTVADPTGAIIPGATIAVTGNGKALSTTSDATGLFHFNGLPAGQYTVDTTIEGFTPYEVKGVTVTPGQNKNLNISLTLAAQQQNIQVTAGSSTNIDTSPESNASAVVIKGADLDALSDDPDELSDELTALAGPSAGPNGAQIYIDGFSGGEIPPKSSIREIIINQNPFSAEFDRLGYGRIQILTKPGTGKMHGGIHSRGNYSGFNAQNPILNANRAPGQAKIVEPSYYSYFVGGDLSGPITSTSSYFANIFHRDNKDVSIVNAIDPASITAANPNGTPLSETVNSPSSRLDLSPRLDLQLGKSNTLTTRYSFYRSTSSNNGVGELSLPERASSSHNMENQLELSDSLIVNKNFIDNIRFRYRRIRNNSSPLFTLPGVSVSGAFSSGGSGAGTNQDHQNQYEIQNYFTGAMGNHALNFGARLRIYQDSNFSNAGTNGAYTFQSTAAYVARTPQQYQVTVVNNNAYTARATPLDLSLFYQDDWTVNRNFTFSYGLRWETQNEIQDKSDWAPRLYFAYAFGHGKQKPKTVLRAGYGWFYERFTLPNGSYGTPYILSTIRHNLPTVPGQLSNQQIYTVTNPTGYTETSPGNAVKPPNPTSSTSAPTYSTIDPHFRAALDMQGAIGIDRQISRNITGNVTYLYSRGIHQYLTNNITAPFFDGKSNIYPAAPLAPPTTNNNQYQSGGVYREDQMIATLNIRMKKLSIFSNYTLTSAKADTNGVGQTPMNASDPRQDYGRATFDRRHRFMILGNVNLPYRFSFAPFFVYSSGRPFNITTGSDLTGNNAFNARPTYAASCTETGVVQTAYGCLNPNPIGTNEKIIPYNLGNGPSSLNLNLRVGKVIGFGPKIKGSNTGGGGYHGGHGGGLRGGLNGGGQSGPGRMDVGVPRKYNLTLSAFGLNVLNHENLGQPNGTLTSPLFGKSQSVAGGFFGGYRTIFLSANVSF